MKTDTKNKRTVSCNEALDIHDQLEILRDLCQAGGMDIPAHLIDVACEGILDGLRGPGEATLVPVEISQADNIIDLKKHRR